MFLRKLTYGDLKKIKSYKDVANKEIKDRYKSIMSPIKEHPVIIAVKDRTICLNYNLLKKIEKSLDKGNYMSWLSIEDKCGVKSLVIEYQHGMNKGSTELYELPIIAVELLTKLPIIDAE